MFLTGAGMGCTFVPVNTAAFANISRSATSRASAVANAQRQVGSALGIALVSTVLGIFGLNLLDAHVVVQPNLNAYHMAFLTSALLAFISACIAFTIRDSDAASTMQAAPTSGEALALPAEADLPSAY